jgi:hypothetical protein
MDLQTFPSHRYRSRNWKNENRVQASQILSHAHDVLGCYIVVIQSSGVSDHTCFSKHGVAAERGCPPGIPDNDSEFRQSPEIASAQDDSKNISPDLTRANANWYIMDCIVHNSAIE